MIEASSRAGAKRMWAALGSQFDQDWWPVYRRATSSRNLAGDFFGISSLLVFFGHESVADR
jgi:hypothetical protein